MQALRNLQVEVKHKVTTMGSSEAEQVTVERVKPTAMPYNLHEGERESLWWWTRR